MSNMKPFKKQGQDDFNVCLKIVKNKNLIHYTYIYSRSIQIMSDIILLKISVGFTCGFIKPICMLLTKQRFRHSIMHTSLQINFEVGLLEMGLILLI